MTMIRACYIYCFFYIFFMLPHYSCNAAVVCELLMMWFRLLAWFKIIEQQQTQKEGQFNNTNTTSNTVYRSTCSILMIFLPGWVRENRMHDVSTNRAICNILSSYTPPSPVWDQERECFEPATKGTSKIILRTNIVQTSLTVPDVSYAIDTCRGKRRADISLHRVLRSLLHSLDVTWSCSNEATDRPSWSYIKRYLLQTLTLLGRVCQG